MLALLVVVGALVIVVVVVGLPIYRAMEPGRGDAPDEDADRTDRADPLETEREAEREAKLREIRDAELDWRTGKLSEADWRVIDSRLRAEAAGLLREGPVSEPAKPAG